MTDVQSKMAGSSRASLILYSVARAIVVTFCRVWFRVRADGLEHVPAEGPFILAPVHRSNLDTLIVAVVTKRRLRYMGKDSLWKARWIAWLLSALGGFPVTRGTADREALIRCMEVLRGGEPLVIFPEGERKSGPVVQPLFEGAAFLAARCQVPIVPVGIGGSERAMPKGSKMIYPRRVHVIIGPPLRVAVPEGGKRIPRDAMKGLTAQVEGELQRLFDLAQIKAGA